METTNTETKRNPLAVVPPVPKAEPAPEGKARSPRKARALPANKRIGKGDKLQSKIATVAKVTDTMRRDQMLAYAGQEKLIPEDADAAIAAFVRVIPQVERQVVRLETEGLAALTLAIRPTVAWLVTPKAGKDQLTEGKTMAAKVVQFLKTNSGKGTLTRIDHARSKAGDDAPITVKVQKPWERLGTSGGDASSRLLRAAQAALLTLYPASKVVIGWTDKPTGKFRDIYSLRPNKKNAVNHPGICAPANVLQPVIYGAVDRERTPQMGFAGLRPEPNPETRLIGLDAGLIDAMFWVFFAGVSPHYETHVPDWHIGAPTGMLIPFRGEPAKRDDKSGTGTAKGDENAEIPATETVEKAALVFRDLPPTKWPVKEKDITAQMAAYGFAYACLLNRACLQGVVATKSFAGHKAAAIAGDILDCLQSNMRSEPDKTGKGTDKLYVLRDDQRFLVTAEAPPTVTPPVRRAGKPAKGSKAA